jgi:hypothetical protein
LEPGALLRFPPPLAALPLLVLFCRLSVEEALTPQQAALHLEVAVVVALLVLGQTAQLV